MESALYGIFTLVGFVSEISLVRCAHSFDFRYFTNSCENPVRTRFPWSNLYISNVVYWCSTANQRKCAPGHHNISGDLAARRAAKRSPISIPYMGNKRKPMSWFSHGCSWLAALLVGTYARRRRRRRRRSRPTWRPYQITGWQTDMQLWFTVYFFGIGHPCYDQLTPVKTRYLLSSITWPYRGLKLTAHRGQVFFLKLTAEQVLVFRLDRGLMSG